MTERAITIIDELTGTTHALPEATKALPISDRDLGGASFALDLEGIPNDAVDLGSLAVGEWAYVQSDDEGEAGHARWWLSLVVRPPAERESGVLVSVGTTSIASSDTVTVTAVTVTVRFEDERTGAVFWSDEPSDTAPKC